MVNHDNYDDFHLVSRYCASKDAFEEQNQECNETILNGYECTVAMCEESGCKAELPKSGMYDVLMLKQKVFKSA